MIRGLSLRQGGGAGGGGDKVGKLGVVGCTMVPQGCAQPNS